MTAEIFKVIASFKRPNGSALTGSKYTVTLMDEDRFFDDKLGDSPLDTNGEAPFLIYTADIVSIDSPDERTPDIYFVVKSDGREIHRTDVIRNVSFDGTDAVTGRPDATTQTFGPFEVPED
jgi:hypothetical protein